MIANDKPEEDVAGRQWSEALLDGQRRVLEMMAADAPLSESLAALVRIIEAHAPGMLGSILLLDEQGIHLRHGAAPSLPLAYVQAIDGVAIGEKVGSCGTAAYLKETVIVEDIASDSRWADYRATALPHGLQACWSTPIFDAERRVVGTFAMYYHHRALPEPQHLRLIEIATHIAAIAICREHAQVLLRESEAKLKEAQQLANIGYWERDLVTDRLTWSKETCRIFGLQSLRQPFDQADLEKLIHPDDRPIQRQALAETRQAHRPYDVEYRIVRPDGEVRTVHIRDAIQYDETGQPVRIFGTVQDITERRRGEEALRESQRLLNLVLATLPVGVTVTDRSGNIILVNAASKQIWGGTVVSGRERWTESEGYWHDSGNRIGPADWASARAMSEGRTVLNELIDIVTYDGQKKTIQNSVAPIRNAEGQIVGVVIVNEDVTERVHTEERLQAQQQEIRAIVENSPDFIVRYDLEMRRTYVNPAFVKMHGLPEELLLAGRLGDYISKADEEIDVLRASFRWVRENGLPLEFEQSWPLPDGRRIFALHFEPEFDSHGALASILGISRDITELKAGEQKLRQMQAELASVSRLTMMGELAVSIAHEINQPLTAVSANADAALNWLGEKPPNLEETRDGLRRIIRDGTRAAEVIARIRSQLKKGQPTRAALNVNELIQETIDFVRSELDRHHIQVETELMAQPPCVEADRVQIQQVLLNLLMNAIDSLRNLTGRPRSLHIRTTLDDDPQMVRLSVEDSGAGIDPEQAHRLFETFFTTKPHGLGMGLAISRSIVEAHGGFLSAAPNAAGPGITFQFTLPVRG
jgi:PAS domain S-box-containing protein